MPQLLPESDATRTARHWRWFYPLLALGFAARAAVALVSDVPLHYDEVMQYLEQAHRAVFGYGIVPWEYREGTRSWLVPGFIAGILQGLQLLGLDRPAVYVPAVKLVFCALSILIPAGMYLFGRAHLGERSARIALVLGCFWYELVVFAHKPLTTFVATALFFLSLSLTVRERNSVNAFLAAAAITLAIAVRIQTAPALVFAMVVIFLHYPLRLRPAFGTGVLSVILFAGLLDHYTWGTWWHSYYRNVEFNLFKGVAASFGTEPFYQYLIWLLIATGGLFYLVLGAAATQRPLRWFLPAMTILILLVHSAIGHKEYRFIFMLVPLWLMMLACLLAATKPWQSVSLASATALIAVLGIAHQLPRQEGVYLAIGYTVHDFLDRRSDRQAYLYLSENESFTGLIDLANIWSISGGYYYLHRQLPNYDRSLFQSHLRDKPLAEYASHILTTKGVESIPGFTPDRSFESDNDGELVLWQRTDNNVDQYYWSSYEINK
jgi:hypothetical protein